MSAHLTHYNSIVFNNSFNATNSSLDMVTPLPLRSLFGGRAGVCLKRFSEWIQVTKFRGK